MNKIYESYVNIVNESKNNNETQNLNLLNDAITKLLSNKLTTKAMNLWFAKLVKKITNKKIKDVITDSNKDRFLSDLKDFKKHITSNTAQNNKLFVNVMKNWC